MPSITVAEALEGGPPPPAAPATPHTPHTDTSPFPPTPPNPYPTPMNTATHTATTTTKAPANAHARSAQSTPPRIPNRPPGIVSPEKEQSRNATQTGQGTSTTPTTREPHPDTTPSRLRRRPSYHSLMEHLIASTFAPLRFSPARPASTSACGSAPIPGRLFPPGEDNFRLVFKMCQTSYRTIHQNNLQQPRQPGKQPPPLRNAGHLLTAPVAEAA